MGALENAKNKSVEEVIEQIASSKIMEYGVNGGLLADRIRQAAAENAECQVPMQIVAALNNSDTRGVLLELLKTDAASVFEGMQILAYVLNAEKMVLFIPEYASELVEKLAPEAEKCGISIECGIVNKRTYRGCLLNHIVTVKELADCFAGSYEEGIYVSVNGKELKKVAKDTKIEELIDTSDVKAIQMGYKLHKSEDVSLTAAEAELLNGVLDVLTSKQCVIAEVEKELLASRKQSCGRCVFCREGLIQLQGMEKDITDGKGKQEYTDLIDEIGSAMTYSTPCSMGQVSSEIALSSVKYFAGEYEEHIKKKQCPAGVCSSFVSIYIDPQKCEGCEECTDVCPADCIEGKAGFIHMIDDFDCTKCGKCIASCEYDAIIQTTGRVPKLPNRLTKCGKFKKH